MAPLVNTAPTLQQRGFAAVRQIARNLAAVRIPGQSLVSRKPTRDVERFGAEEAGEIDLDPVWETVRQLYRTGLHPAIALSVRHKGKLVIDRTIGHLRHPPGGGDPGPVVTPDTLFNLFSATKIVTATLVHALVDDGLLDLDKPAVHYLPDFARHGKQDILLRHLLNHTAGIPDMPKMERFEELLKSGRMDLDLLYDLRPQTTPGARVAYHAMTSWFLVQEIIERATGMGLRQALRQRILDPLGFKHLDYGVLPDLVPQVANHAVTGPKVPAFATKIFDRNIGVSLDRAVQATNDADFLTTVLPSANCIGTPSEVSRFMQLLLQGGELDGVRVMSEAAIHRATTEVTRVQLDGTFGFPMRYGLGYMMGGNRFSLFGLGTRGAFGHLGLSNVVVYADPSRELSVAFLNTGKPILAPGMLTWYAALQQIVMRVPRSVRL
jgi:CubicO group peptidase (beta-lactamase class C family)